ncbi:MAG: tRNA (adenosine(37)-N6)-threonylcarbamoyltransferase complex ATPase subunit type 1 TsaE, partial [Candidatus Omnitrophica bacterium]|nr:tRNA (adenosine(37)-N6)-threonylcarbamoyltransferase complex ATPase subunit type 1 TsaE [Candidatus Omnitrophota bacterium]
MPLQKWKTHSPIETIERGRAIGRTLKPGTMIALVGDLGSGKTTLVKGLALGLGVQDAAHKVKSPSFVIFHIYKGRAPLYHFDLYRLDESSDLEEIGMDEFLSDPNAISVVEWADRIPAVFNQAPVRIELTSLSETDRIIRMYSH